MVETEKHSGGKPEKWGGAVDMVISSATMHQIEYVENEPFQISFSGGYVQKNGPNPPWIIRLVFLSSIKMEIRQMY